MRLDPLLQETLLKNSVGMEGPRFSVHRKPSSFEVHLPFTPPCLSWQLWYLRTTSSPVEQLVPVTLSEVRYVGPRCSPLCGIAQLPAALARLAAGLLAAGSAHSSTAERTSDVRSGPTMPHGGTVS